MKVSVCVTVLNEEKSIAELLEAILYQTRKPDEIVIVDGGSTDGTLEIISKFQKRSKKIKLLTERSSRAKGRNLSVEISNSEIIAMTDAGCVPQKDWLKNIVKPFEYKVDVVAGFYKMKTTNRFQKALSAFLGILPQNFDEKFLPSTRSIAFTKEVWEKVGGFPEKMDGTAEDTVFNLKLISHGIRLSRVKNAVVEWGMPGDFTEFFWKIYNYALGDSKSRVWAFPGKGLTSHNIKALFVVIRYILGIWIAGVCFMYGLAPLVLVLVLIYIIWSFKKIYDLFGDWRTALWGPPVQLVCDIAVIGGFILGLFK